jgi:hypothetical protein
MPNLNSSSAGTSNIYPFPGVTGNSQLVRTGSNTTGGGGSGGNGMESRIAKLESSVESININITDVRDDVRDIRNWGLVLFLAVFAALGSLYLYVNSVTKELTKSVSDLSVATTKEIAEARGDIRMISVKSDSVTIRLDAITSSIERLISATGQNDYDNPKEIKGK